VRIVGLRGCTHRASAYLIVDPYTAEWQLHTLSKDGVYHAVVGFPFGEEIDLTGTPVGLVLRTDEFPGD
jgi:hypothetical protein